jgi:trans-2,3-dihydro-3-hydroxyanthranilate isomerase
MGRTAAYEVWDVFTDRAFGGNQLAVVIDARDIPGGEMQAIAREFGYSETVFVLPPEAGGTARARIFTPGSELPFAGHPTIGTATCLARRGQIFGTPVPARLVLEEGVGPIVCNTGTSGGTWSAAFVSEAPFTVLGECDPPSIAACLGLEADDIRRSAHPPRMASKGLPFVFAELRDRPALARAKPVAAGFETAARGFAGKAGFFSVATYVRTSAQSAAMRVFAPLDGIPEDPATGSAAAALAALLCELEGAPVTLAIDQGVEMGRPSRIDVTAERLSPDLSRVTVAGTAVPVMSGVLHLP